MMEGAINTESRQTELYGTLITFLILNNITLVARIFVHTKIHFNSKRPFFLEDIFILASGICVNVIIGCLLASTHYGLGLHGKKIYADDPNAPYNMSKVFQMVWITMVLGGPTLTFIKLSLLFLYRRLFLVNQKWLRIAWWINLVYVVLWFFGATGFYLFQCAPVYWYYKRYYQKYLGDEYHGEKGQCNATTVQHVAMPLIFGLVSDVALLLLPVTAIVKLQVSTKKKFGLAGVFSVGLLACVLELVRIIELEVDTDDQVDPSYGVVIFLILTVAEEVSAIICASLPVVIPQVFRKWKDTHDSDKVEQDQSIKLSSTAQSRAVSRGFHKLGEQSGSSLDSQNQPGGTHAEWPLGLDGASLGLEGAADSRIVVKKEYEVTVANPAPK